MSVEGIRMYVLFERLEPYGFAELLSVEVVAECAALDVFEREGDGAAVSCCGIVVLLLVLLNAFYVGLVAVDNLCSAACEGVA